MPNTTPSGYFNFDDAPGGNLDDIFATTNEPVTQQVTPVVATPVATTESPTPTPAEPFLKTSTGTVYNTADDAVKGTEHKDELITQLRQQLLQATKVDPITQRPAANTPIDPALVSYIEDPKKYFADLKKAQTEQEVLSVQQRFINETLAPYVPVFASMVKTQAVEQIASDVPTIRTFLGSQEYQDTLNSFPLLKQSIQISEAYPERSGDLSQLYRMAFDASAGRNLPKAVQSGTITSPVVSARPTVSSTPATPPPIGSSVAPPSFGTKEGRKTIMDDQVARGVENLRF